MSTEHSPAPRRRGRPRKNEAADTRANIVNAAHDEFMSKGFEATSIRGIARAAGVDPSLVHHYFDNKSDLLAASLDLPMRPDVELPRILATPPAERAATLLRFILTVWDDPAVQKRGILLLRSASGQGLVSRLIRDFVVREIFSRIASSIEAEGAKDAELRAQLVATQIVGLIVLRFGLKVEPLASADVEDIVRRVAPGLSVHLVGPPTVEQE